MSFKKARRLLRKKHLKERYGYSYRHLNRLIDQGKLPPPHFPFGNSVETWFEDVLDEWDLAAANLPFSLLSPSATPRSLAGPPSSCSPGSTGASRPRSPPPPSSLRAGAEGRVALSF